jgi:hypothetical protein
MVYVMQYVGITWKIKHIYVRCLLRVNLKDDEGVALPTSNRSHEVKNDTEVNYERLEVVETSYQPGTRSSVYQPAGPTTNPFRWQSR